MYNWRIELSLEECVAQLPDPSAEYCLVMRMEHKFSPPTPHLKPTPSTPETLPVHHTLTLHLNSQPTLPKLQVLLVLAQSPTRPQQQIIAIATIAPNYPNPPQNQQIQSYLFEKGLVHRAHFKAKLNVYREDTEQKSTEKASSPQQVKTELEEEPSLLPPKSARSQELESVMKERDQLYRMSQELYHQLKKCMGERDKYLLERDEFMVELRERILSEEQTKQELEFLKLKLDEHDAELGSGQTPLRELQGKLQELEDENERMENQLSMRNRDVEELQRKVREAIRAMEEFKKEALQARSELLRKESQYSLATKHSGYLQPEECMEEINKELERRRSMEQELVLPLRQMPQSYDLGKMSQEVMTEVNRFAARVISRLKGRDCELVRKEKIELQRRLTSRLQPYLGSDFC